MDASQRFLALVVLVCFIGGYWLMSTLFSKKRTKPLSGSGPTGSSDSCLFCGRSLEGNRAKEHVVSSWLLRHMGIEHEIVMPAVASSSDREIIEKRRHSADALLEGRICKVCNEGWMSRLEDEVKPILIPLMEGSRSVFGLGDKERLILSRWAAKTAYMLNSSSSLHDYVEERHLRELADDAAHLPGGVAVFAQQHGLADAHTRYFSWVQQNHWPYLPLRPPAEHEKNTGEGGYKIGLQFDKLLLLVVYWPHPSWNFILGAGMHVPLWPLLPTVRAYTINETLPVNDSFLVLMAFTRLVAVAEVQRPRLLGGWALVRR